MTVSNEAASVTAFGDGSNTTFAFDFEVPYQADGVTPAVAVFVIDADGVWDEQTLTTDFTITGVGNPAGGEVTYPATGSPLSSSEALVIMRDLDYSQESAFEDQGFRAASVETAVDALEMQLQQVVARASRLILEACLVSELPNCDLNIGARGVVLDATATTFASVVSGSGANIVPVYSTGEDWRIG